MCDMSVNKYDAFIIGKGPAGAQAAVYVARAGLRAAMTGHDSGSLALAALVENYYGFPEPVSGAELQRRGEAQARSFGATVYNYQVTGFGYGDDGQYLIHTDAAEFSAKAVLIATGAKRANAPVKGIGAFEGKGVSYCAVCDGFLYRGRKTGVLGNAGYALAEARELAAINDKVAIFTNGAPDNFGDSGAVPGFSENAVPRAPVFEIVRDPILGLEGDERLTGIRFQNGGFRELDGLFIAYGTAGSSDLAKKLGVLLTEKGDIITDGNQATNIPGVFAAGDCTGSFRQAAVAAGQGAAAARGMIEYVRSGPYT